MRGHAAKKWKKGELCERVNEVMIVQAGVRQAGRAPAMGTKGRVGDGLRREEARGGAGNTCWAKRDAGDKAVACQAGGVDAT
jgi:hypothetical protein